MADSLCLGNFDVLETLGAGSFSTVIKARPKLRPELSVVLKETRGISSSGVTRASVAREVEMLKAARGCAFISQFYAAFIEGDKHYMVMEYVTGGDLLKTVQQCIAVKTPPDEATLWRYLYELGQGVVFLHEKGIVHRDIKCQNIMLSAQGHIKLIDLGLAAAIAPGQVLTERCGTPFYMAVEMINKHPYDQRVDVWSSGCVFYMLAQLRPAFNGANLQSLCRSIIEDAPGPLCGKRFSPHLSVLILRMLDKDRARRPTMAQVLAHPFFAHYPHFPQELFQDVPVFAYGGLDPSQMPAAVPSCLHQQQQQQQAVAAGAYAHAVGRVGATAVGELEAVGTAAAMARAVHVYGVQEPTPGPVMTAVPYSSVGGATEKESRLKLNESLDLVLPELALQESEQLTNVPLAAEGEAGPQLISLTPTHGHAIGLPAHILLTEKGVPPPPLLPLHLLGEKATAAPALPHLTVDDGFGPPPFSPVADEGAKSTVPLPPATPNVIRSNSTAACTSQEGPGGRLTRLLPVPLTRAASSPNPVSSLLSLPLAQNPHEALATMPSTPVWAGHGGGSPVRLSPAQQQRTTAALPFPSSPRVRALMGSGRSQRARQEQQGWSPNSSFGSQKRALVELGPDDDDDDRSAFGSSVSSSNASDCDAGGVAFSSSLGGGGGGKRTRTAAAAAAATSKRQPRMVAELMEVAAGLGLERTHSSPGRMMASRFGFFHGQRRRGTLGQGEGEGEAFAMSPPARGPAPVIDACVSSTSLASAPTTTTMTTTTTGRRQQQQQQLQACFAALALPSASGSPAASMASLPGVAASSSSAPSTPLRRSPRRKNQVGGGSGALLSSPFL